MREAFQHRPLIILQEGFDLPFELLFVRRSHVLAADRAVARDEERRRQAPDRTLRVYEIRMVRPTSTG